MEFPHRRTPDAHALYQNSLAPMKLDKASSQKGAFAKLAFLDRHIFIEHSPQALAGRISVGTAFFGSAPALPLPPVSVAGLAIECAFASDGDIDLLECKDQRRIVVAFHSFKSCEDDGQIGFWIGRKFQCGLAIKMEFHVAFQ